MSIKLSCSILYTILVYQKSHLENVLSSQFIQIGLNPQPLVLNDDNNNNNDDDDDDDDDKIQYIIHDSNLSRYTMSHNP